MVSARRFLLRSLVTAGVLTALIWPALYNGEPFFYPDTRSYIRAADAGVFKLTGIKSPWTNADDVSSAKNAVVAAPSREPDQFPSPYTLSITHNFVRRWSCWRNRCGLKVGTLPRVMTEHELRSWKR
jgi:hypothetical protein